MTGELAFDYAPQTPRALFGIGRIAELNAELDRLDVSRALFACTPSGAARYRGIIEQLGARCVAVFAGAEPHCPEPVALAALKEFLRANADGVVTVGGGSTIGLGKYIARATGRPYLAVPTTLSGSEMTSVYGIKVGFEKRTGRDARAMARTVIYDPALTTSLPCHETATTGMNSLAHCVEALYPATPSPVASALALEGIRALAEGLPWSVEKPGDLAARSRALYGGFLGGLMIAMVGLGLHHKLCHVLGGRYGAPHGESNSVILAHVMAFNAPAIPDTAARIAAALGGENAARAIFNLAKKIGAPTSLKEIGVAEAGLDDIAAETTAQVTYNPRPVDAASIRHLLDDAWHGRRPSG